MTKILCQSNKKRVVVLITLSVLFIINTLGIVSAFAADEDIIVFTDTNLKTALIDAGVDTGGDGEITQGELKAFSDTLDLSQKEISDLFGMEYATGITVLDIGGNTINDISTLSGLAQLTSLDISGNTINDIGALSGLAQLTSLDIGGNTINDISALLNLTQLTSLDISDNTVRDISALSGLVQLTALDVSNNYLDITEGSDDMAVISGLQGAGCTVVYSPQKDIPVDGISLDITSAVLCPGDTTQLTETVSPADAANKTAVWSSSNENVATVTDGLVTAKAVGSAKITAATDDGGFTADCDITIKSAVFDSSIYSIDQTKNILQDVTKDTSAVQLKANLKNDVENIFVYDKNGNEYTGSCVATGMRVKLIINDVLRDELRVAVLGDGNGDGNISITDYTLARLDILGLKSLSNEFAEAMDINGDGDISITDYTLVRLDILELKEITGEEEFTIDVTDPQILAFLTMALAQQGDPYVWGDEGPDSFDCSGFVHYCLNQSGYSMWRATANTYSAYEQWEYVSRENLQPGDLMFYFSDTIPNHIGHIGIYLGDGYHIHASSTYGCIIICQVDGWYDDMLSHGRRVF